jgi:hypothetical protein
MNASHPKRSGWDAASWSRKETPRLRQTKRGPKIANFLFVGIGNFRWPEEIICCERFCQHPCWLDKGLLKNFLGGISPPLPIKKPPMITGAW